MKTGVAVARAVVADAVVAAIERADFRRAATLAGPTWIAKTPAVLAAAVAGAVVDAAHRRCARAALPAWVAVAFAVRAAALARTRGAGGAPDGTHRRALAPRA